MKESGTSSEGLSGAEIDSEPGAGGLLAGGSPETGTHETGGHETGGHETACHETGSLSVSGNGEFSGTGSMEISHSSFEVPASMKEAQSYVDTMHQTSVGMTLETSGQYMTQGDLERIQNGTQVRAIDSMEMAARTGGHGAAGLYSHGNGSSEIDVLAMNYGQMRKTAFHETQHYMSHNSEIYVPDPENHTMKIYQTTGLRETAMEKNTETGKVTHFRSNGLGLNEGMTNVYAYNQVKEIDPENALKNERNGTYPEATALSRELEALVGSETMKEAYYGGNKDALKEKVNTLAGDKKAFEKLEKAFDKAVSSDSEVQEKGVREVQFILATMYGNGGEDTKALWEM